MIATLLNGFTPQYHTIRCWERSGWDDKETVGLIEQIYVLRNKLRGK